MGKLFLFTNMTNEELIAKMKKKMTAVEIQEHFGFDEEDVKTLLFKLINEYEKSIDWDMISKSSCDSAFTPFNMIKFIKENLGRQSVSDHE